MFVCLLFPWTASDAARAYAADVAEAIDRTMPRKVAASTMRIPESLLSEQLACVDGKQLSASRLADLPPAFHAELEAIRARRRGAVLLQPELVELLRGAAHVAKATLRPYLTRRRA